MSHPHSPKPSAEAPTPASTDVATAAAVHKVSYQRQRSSTQFSGPTPNPEREFWLPAPSHPDYTLLLDDIESFAKNHSNLLVPIPAWLAPKQSLTTLDQMLLRLEEFAKTVLTKGDANVPWAKAFREGADHTFKAHANGQPLTFAGQTVTPVHLAPTDENRPRTAYLVFPWAAERTPFVAGRSSRPSRPSLTRQPPAASTAASSLAPPSLSRYATSPSTFPPATPTDLSHGPHPPTLARSTTTLPLDRAVARPKFAFPPCPHPPAPLAISWSPTTPNRARKYCCLMRTVERAIDAGLSRVDVPECVKWILAEDDKDRRDCFVELANYTPWMSAPWILAAQQAGHMFGAADPCSPQFVLRAAANANERVEAITTKDPARTGYVLLYNVRQDVLRVLLCGQGVEVSRELVDRMFEWVEQGKRGHVDAWYDALALLNQYLRYKLSTLPTSSTTARTIVAYELASLNALLAAPAMIQELATVRLVHGPGSDSLTSGTSASTSSSDRSSSPASSCSTDKPNVRGADAEVDPPPPADMIAHALDVEPRHTAAGEVPGIETLTPDD